MNTEKGSDTPRTDAAKSTSMFIDGEGVVEAKICRQLERELAEWKACAERLAKAIETGNAHGYGLRIGDDALAEFDRLKQKSSP